MNFAVTTMKTGMTRLEQALTTLPTWNVVLVMLTAVMMAAPPYSVTTAPLSGVTDFWNVRGRTILCSDRAKLSLTVWVVLVRLVGMAPTFECSDLVMSESRHIVTVMTFTRQPRICAGLDKGVSESRTPTQMLNVKKNVTSASGAHSMMPAHSVVVPEKTVIGEICTMVTIALSMSVLIVF